MVSLMTNGPLALPQAKNGHHLILRPSLGAATAKSADQPGCTKVASYHGPDERGYLSELV